MKITKFSVILFIFLLVISFIPPIGGNMGYQQLDQPDRVSNLGIDQTSIASFREEQLDAHISYVERNVTIKSTAKVVLEDKITLKVVGNETEIRTFNYTVPSSFALSAHEVTIWSQLGDNLGLESSNNSKAYSVLYGHQVTTFSFDITEEGFGANDSIDGTYIQTRLVAWDIIDISGQGTGQLGVFESPVTPFFPNLPVLSSQIGINLESTGTASLADEFDVDIERFENELGREMPEFSQDRKSMTYTNMSRTAFNYDEGLIDRDASTVVFDSETGVGTNLESSPTVLPTKIREANRTVRFDPWGKVFVREAISVMHLGAGRNITVNNFQNIHQLSGFTYVLDSDAQITDIYDELGSLHLGQDQRDEDTGYPVTTASGIPGKQSLQFKFRTTIFGGQTYSFTVEYEYNASQVISIDSDTKEYTLNTTLFSDFNTTMDNFNLRVQLPAGSVYRGNNYIAQSPFVTYELSTSVNKNPLSSFKHLELVYDMENVSYTDNIGFQIYFSYNGMGHLQFVATYLYTVVALLAVIYALSSVQYRPSKAVEIEKQLIPIAEMDAFFNLFSEKTGAEKRIAELRSQRLKGKLSKKDYDGKVKSIRRRLRDLNPQLEKAANKLSSKGGRYENYVNRVMLASQRQSDIRRNAREAKKSYERGSIPKNIYQLRIREFNNELAKQESLINRTLTEMVEVIQKYNQ